MTAIPAKIRDPAVIPAVAAEPARRRFLFVTWEGGGNVPPVLGLARRLVQRGHDVRVISDPANEPEIRAAGCEFISYTHAPHRCDKSAASTVAKDYEAKGAVAALRASLDLSCGQALAYAQDVLEEIERRPVDAVAVNQLMLGGHFAAEVTRVPSAMLMPNCYILPAPGMPPPGGLPLGGWPGKVRGLLTAFMYQRLMRYCLPPLQRARKALGLARLDSPLHYLERLDRILVMTSPAFDFPARLPANVRYVGPILDDPAGLGSWQSPWPAEDPDPLVVVAFSTTYQDHGAALQRVINTLGELKVRSLVTLGPALDASAFRVPQNVVLRMSVPHALVFPSAAAVVTHAGHGTVIRALAVGVPLLCLPMGRDQPGNAARTVARGAGLRPYMGAAGLLAGLILTLWLRRARGSSTPTSITRC